MSKLSILSVLNALLDRRNRPQSEALTKEGIEDWANTVFKGFRKSVKEEEPALVCPKRQLSDSSEDEFNDNVVEVIAFLNTVQVPRFPCDFNIPQVRTRIEKLMGTNYVSLTDRNYMQKLQERILEDYEEQMQKRIKLRQEEEMERVKNLVLAGKIPLDQAPPEMAQHPIMLIENYCNQKIAERRAKIKIYRVKIPTYLYWDDTPDPPSGLSIESGHVFRQQGEKLCHPVELHLGASEDEDIENGYLMGSEQYDNIKYESSLVKRLMDCETVEEMYALADDIIGVLKTIDESSRVPEDNISDTLMSAS